MHIKRHFKLTEHLITAITVGLSLILLVFFLTDIRKDREQYLETAALEISAYTRDLAETAEKKLTNIHQILDHVSETIPKRADFYNSQNEDILLELFARTKYNSAISVLFLTDKYGSVLHNSQSTNGAMNLAQRQYFKTLAKTPYLLSTQNGSQNIPSLGQRIPNYVISEPVIGTTISKPLLVVIARPIFDENGEFNGVAGATINIASFPQYTSYGDFSSYDTPHTYPGIMFLAHSGGKVFLELPSLSKRKHTISYLPIELQKLLDQVNQDNLQREVFFSQHANRPSIISITEITGSHYNWIYVLPERIALAQWWSSVLNDVILYGIALILLWVLSFYVRKYVRRRKTFDNVLEKALNSIDNGFALYDEHQRLRHFNQNFLSFFEPLSDQDLLGKKYGEILNIALKEGVFHLKTLSQKQYKDQLIADFNRRTLNKDLFLQDGEILLVSHYQTSNNWTVSIYSNVTSMRQREQRLLSIERKLKEQTEDLIAAKIHAESANRAKSHFLATMSHELRTPMTGVMGMINLLSKSGLNKEQADYTETMRNSAETLLQVLNDVLDVAKIESGHIHIEERPLNLRLLIEEKLRLFNGIADMKKIQLSFDYASSLPETFLGDALRIGQILQNLIGNALKFTQEGTVKISVLKAHNLQQDLRLISFRIEDTGIGIPVEDQHKIFTPFYQSNKSNNTSQGGTGLGLPICKELIEAMGGSITLSSQLGQGSCFDFTLILQETDETITQANPPRLKEPIKHHPLSDDAPEELPQIDHGYHILLAEDNKVNQQLITVMMKRAGFMVTSVENGKVAIETLRKQKFDLILMDMQMPIMDGETATKWIRTSEDDFSQIPIVALTADIIPEHQQRYQSAGINAFFEKPINWQLLYQTCFTLISDHKEIDTEQKHILP